MQTDVIRRISIEASQKGVAESTDGLKKLAVAQDNQTHASLSMASALEKQQRSLDIAYRSTQQFEQAQRTLNQAQQQGLLTAQRYAELSAMNTARMQDQTKAANDNAEGFRSSGVELALTANHIRLAAAAAYTLSPAFRELVNPIIKEGLTATRTALAAMGPTAAGVATEIGSRMLPALALIGRIALPITIVVEAIRAMAAITELGAQKLKEFNDIAANAGAAGVSTDFFQRQAKGAEELGLKTDDATAALKRFNEVSQPALGGSAFEQRLDELVKAGNFVGNSGVAAYKAAGDAEERYRAVVDLITQAMDAGQRLAALDLAAKFLPPKLLDQLRANGQVLKEMQETADAIKPVDIVSPEQIGYAIELKRRLDEANKTMTDGLKPIQKDLTQLGLNYQESWVSIVELEASAITGLNTMYGWVKSIGDVFTYIGNLPFWSKLTELTARMGLNSSPESMGLTLPGQPGFTGSTGAGSAANSQLAGALYNPTAIFQAMLKANNTQYGPQKDTSINPTKEIEEVNDAVDKAINTLQRHVEQQQADTKAVGLGAAALALYRAQAMESAAVKANDGEETAKQAAQFKQLQLEAEAAAGALEKAKIASQIDFASKTKFLSADDLAIAQQLRGIYGNDVPAALASTEAAQLRVVNAQKMLSDGFQDVGKAMFTAFLSGKNIVDAMVGALDNLAKKLSDAAFSNILQGVLSGNAVQATVGVIEAGASALISAFTGDTKAKKAMQEAQNAWHAMSGQVTNFNLAAKGFNLGPLTSQLQQMEATWTTLRKAADTANDVAGAAALNKSWREGVLRIMDAFKTGSDVLTPLQSAMKALNDDAAGLEATLSDLHYNSYVLQVGEDLKARIAQLIATFQQQFVTGLTARLNTANGNAFLNDTANLLLQHQADLASAKDLGNDPTLLAQVAATFHAEAQKIVDDAGLIGPAFDGFLKQFPQLAGVVVQANADMSASAKQLQAAANASARTIVDFVNGLYASSSSPLSPTAQLANAQSAYNAKLALAQGGNADAQSTITKDAQTLLDAAKAVYASSTGFQSIFSTVTNQLLGLPAVQNTTDPVTQALRDVLSAINLGNSTQATQTTLASVALTSQATKDNTAAASSLLTTTNSLTSTANSLATTQNSLLTSIQSLQSTANTQLTLLQAALAPSTIVVQPSTSGGYSGGGSGVTLQNQMVVALNKIVWNTYQTANNTQFTNMPHGAGLVGGVYAGGGWISGGIAGIDSVRLASGGLGMPGEFVVRQQVAQANKSWLADFNATGRIPAPAFSGAANDNSALLAEIRALRAELADLKKVVALGANLNARATCEAGDRIVEATAVGSSNIAQAARLRARAQR